MGLRSMGLVVTLAMIAVALLAGMLWLWPRLSRQRPVTVLARIVLLTALQVTVLAFVFVWVNRSLEFYASWPDLLGTDSLSGIIVSVPGTRSAAATSAVTVLGSSAVTAPGERRGDGGRLQLVRIRGALSGITTLGYLYLPPGYSASGPRLPVIVAVSDQATRSTAVYGARRIAETASAQIAGHHLPASIVVVLPGALARRGCVNVPGGPQVSAFFTQDLTQALQRDYRGAPAPGGWAVLGGPGAGYCALQLATAASDPFDVVVAPPGSYAAPPGGDLIPSGLTGTSRSGRTSASGAVTVAAEVPASPALRDQDSVLWRLRHWPPPPVRVLLAGPGTAGALLASAHPPLRVATAGLAPGAWPLTPVFDWIGNALRSPA